MDLRLTVDTFPEGNKIRKTASQRQAARRSLQCSAPDLALEDSILVFGKDCEVRST
jgi:hypothetical protein